MVDCICYLVMLQKNLVVQLLVTEISVHSQWFIQGRAKLHMARAVLHVLHETSSDMLMSHHFPWHHKFGHIWPPHRSYILIISFFSLQGFLKKKLFMTKCTTLVECKALIIQLCRTVAEDMCRRWSRVLSSCWRSLDHICGHIKHIIH